MARLIDGAIAIPSLLESRKSDPGQARRLPHKSLPHKSFWRYVLILASITGISSPTLLQLPTSAADIAQTPASRYQPLPPAACNQLAQAMTNALKVRVRMTRGSFVDYINREQGIGCQLIATGDGRNFNQLSDIVSNLSDLLAKQGWSEVSDYTADGPTEVARGFRQGNSLAVFNVEWEPAPGASCPQNQPISACQLRPDQQIYRIRVNAATK